jgi:hypothetical protein
LIRRDILVEPNSEKAICPPTFRGLGGHKNGPFIDLSIVLLGGHILFLYPTAGMKGF